MKSAFVRPRVRQTAPHEARGSDPRDTSPSTEGHHVGHRRGTQAQLTALTAGREWPVSCRLVATTGTDP